MQRPLWPHQQAALHACLATLGKRPGYVQMPTGSGKSEVIRHVALAWLSEPRHKVIIAVPNRTLAFQHRADFIMYTKHIPTLLLEGFKLARASRLIVSTYASLHKVPHYQSHFPVSQTLLIADECHHCNCMAEQNRNLTYLYKHRLGFSATPWSEGCSSCFAENLVYSLSLVAAQRNGCLCTFVIEMQSALMPNPYLKHQMFFVHDSSRFQQAILLKSVFFDDPITPHRPYGNDRIIEAFRDGSIACVYVNRMLLEGFDCAKIKHIYIEKETDSDLLAMQMIGRGLRMVNDQVCKVMVNNARSYETVMRAIERANTPEVEPYRWQGKHQ